ncbi:polyhomeotic-like protein 3 [Clavelina lepadiformis]|uniref:polyhomeotic-like protein 3 n=1 Tax=Clavelina lepadiformis TaxID=159417 RepID=UPI00404242DD
METTLTSVSQVDNVNDNDAYQIQDNAENNNKRIPEVKQHIITHIIDGFVFEESLTPFTPTRNCGLSNHQLSLIRKRQQEILQREKDMKSEDDEKMNVDNQDNIEVAVATCEQCGFSGPRVKFSSPSQQFCSLKCARKYKTRITGGVHSYNKLWQNNHVSRRGKSRIRNLSSLSNKPRRGRPSYVAKKEEDVLSSSQSLSGSNSFSDDDKFSSSDSASVFSYSPTPSPEPTVPYLGGKPVQPGQWSVDDVWNYMRSLPDAVQYAADFRAQEIDGSALLLLHEEHLVSSMNFPLGPALKLCAHIDRLREKDFC